MIEIYVTKPGADPPFDSENKESLLKRLPEELRHKYAQTKQQSSFAAALMVQKVAKEKLQVFSPLDIGYGLQGKPFFKDYPQLHFNVSHSKDYVCAGFSENPLGIDIEKNRACKEAIVTRFLHPQEIKDILSITNAEWRSHYFTQIWSLKESYVKYNGQGIANQFKDFFVQVKEDGTVVSSLSEKPFFSLLSCLEGYQLSVCAAKEEEVVVRECKVKYNECT